MLGLPLGDTALRAPAAAMVNLLGSGAQSLDDQSLMGALAEPHAYVHLYGKAENRAGRKMGHVTAIGETREEALARARRVAQRINV